ncbi:hypothetical protein GQ42DRAFT_103427, partial [Ramicandelaber brevisporus]
PQPGRPPIPNATSPLGHAVRPNAPSPHQPPQVPVASRTPAPPASKYPPGDRSHIPAQHRIIFTALNGEFERLRPMVASAQHKVVDETEKRLSTLFDGLNCETINPVVIPSLLQIAQAASARDYRQVQQIQLEITRNHFDAASAWIVGIKGLVNIA